MLIELLDLKQQPQHLAQLATWHHREWSHLNPQQNLHLRQKEMQSHLGQAFIPTTFIATEQEVLIGSAAIIESDMDTHPELTPWLASVYVKPECRGKGIGTDLVNYTMQQSKMNGLDKLYLFTPDQEIFYKNLGWTIMKEEEYRDIAVTIMSVQL